MLAAGVRRGPDRPLLQQILFGGSSAAFYGSIFAAYQLYGLLPCWPTLSAPRWPWLARLTGLHPTGPVIVSPLLGRIVFFLGTGAGFLLLSYLLPDIGGQAARENAE